MDPKSPQPGAPSRLEGGLGPTGCCDAEARSQCLLVVDTFALYLGRVAGGEAFARRSEASCDEIQSATTVVVIARIGALLWESRFPIAEKVVRVRTLAFWPAIVHECLQAVKVKDEQSAILGVD